MQEELKTSCDRKASPKHHNKVIKHPRSDKHKTYLREGIFNTKKVLENE